MDNKTKQENKTNIDVLLSSIDKQLLVKLLDSLIREQLPTTSTTPSTQEAQN